jgi:hypothetical protein
MSHFAEIDENGNVLRVIVADSLEWCQTRLGGTWVQTSYTASMRGNYAGIGYQYRSDIDKFVPPQPVYNYDLDTETASWIFPDGDHIYVPIASDAAISLSQGLYSLIDPSKPGMYCGIVPHGERQYVVALQLRESDVVPIALGADPSPLAAILAPFVTLGNLTQEELDGILGGIVAMAGQAIPITSLIPPSWQPFVMDEEAAIEEGYLVQ